ncbi:MAG: hypothetical protein HZB46_18975 [Solirubrobacterales bacterium]|nr:hypothetical protein [Solirubrobacterales bacterium]
MIRRARAAAAALVAATGVALVPAGAQAASWLDPGRGATYVPVPDGLMEHRVTEATVQIGDERYTTRTDFLVASDRARVRSYDAGTGALVVEDASAGDTWRSWWAETNVLRTYRMSRPGRPVQRSARTEAAILREQVARGWLRVTSETVHGGVPALVLELGHDAPDTSAASERIVVEKGSYRTLERRAVLRAFVEAGREVRSESTVKVVVDEDLPRDDAQLAMADHPGARVVGGGDGEATAARKSSRAKAKAKARAKAQAKAKARAKAKAKATRRG